MTHKNRPLLLYYCQSLVGIGHLTASLQVIRELLGHSDIDLIYGGHSIDITLEHPGFRYICLPSILIHDKTGELYDPSEQYTIKQLWTLRASHIATFLSQSYAAIIVEFFPFGRRRFKNEIYALFNQVRRDNDRIPIFSFVREVLVPETAETEQRIVQSVNQHIHTVFIRGDANVIRFNETFSLTDQIADKIYYVGYLGSAFTENNVLRKPQILVSLGGGSIGQELLEAAIQTAPLLPNYIFLIATGTKTSAEDVAKLTKMITSANVKIVPFLQDFKRHLLESALSISMGGDNTLVEVISTRTPGLAYPFPGNSEQTTRIKKLAENGFIHALSSENLKPEKLYTTIVTALNSPNPDVKIKLNGAFNMSKKIKSILVNGN